MNRCMIYIVARPIGQVVKMPHSQCGDRGSTPLWAVNILDVFLISHIFVSHNYVYLMTGTYCFSLTKCEITAAMSLDKYN